MCSVTVHWPLWNDAYPFKAYWLCVAPTSLTFKNSTLCPHCIYVCAVFIWKQTATCATYSYYKLTGFYNRDESVYCVVWTGSLNKAVCASSLNG